MLIQSTWKLKINQETLLPCAYSTNLIKLLYQKMGLEFTAETLPEITFSGILGNYKKNDNFYILSPEEDYYLSLSGLELSASKAIKELNFNNDKLDFLGISFQVGNREDDITTYEQLYSELVAEDPESIKDYRLEFLTPTSFAQGKMNLPLPLPSLMFHGWLNKWNNFCNIYLGSDELIDYLSNNIYLNYYRLNTRKLQINQQKVTGFVGEINLKIPQRVDDLLANVANLLINYSQYCGTGIKTRLGMGNTKILHLI